MALNIPQYTPPEYPDLSQSAYLASIGKADNGWNRFWSASGANYDSWRTDQLNRHEQSLNQYNENFKNYLNSYGFQMAARQSAGLSPYLAEDHQWVSNPASPSFGQYPSIQDATMSKIGATQDLFSNILSLIGTIQNFKKQQLDIKAQEYQNSILFTDKEYLAAKRGMDLLQQGVLTYGPEYARSFASNFSNPTPVTGAYNFWDEFNARNAPFFKNFESQGSQRLASAESSLANARSQEYKTDNILPLILASYKYENAVKKLDAHRAEQLDKYVSEYVESLVTTWDFEKSNNELQKKLLEMQLGLDMSNSIIQGVTAIGSLLLKGLK